jgi:hypothetical protein
VSRTLLQNGGLSPAKGQRSFAGCRLVSCLLLPIGPVRGQLLFLVPPFSCGRGKEEPTSGLEPLTCSLRVRGQRLLGLHRSKNPAWVSGFLFPALPVIAGRCVRVRATLGSSKASTPHRDGGLERPPEYPAPALPDLGDSTGGEARPHRPKVTSKVTSSLGRLSRPPRVLQHLAMKLTYSAPWLHHRMATMLTHLRARTHELLGKSSRVSAHRGSSRRCGSTTPRSAVGHPLILCPPVPPRRSRLLGSAFFPACRGPSWPKPCARRRRLGP